jgi:pimeloyl-ACP methyl ester carboxylesterase
MKTMKRFNILKLIVGCWALCQAQWGMAQNYKTQYVSLGRQSAVLYQPVQASEKSSVGIVVMHSNEDYLGFLANSELSKRGYTVLATLPAEGDLMDAKLLSVKACVDYLRSMSGIKKVLLLGHSGGATVMTAYQLIAEKGTGVLKDKLFNAYSRDLSHLSKADGVVLLDANYGNSVMRLLSLDPNIKGRGQGNGNAHRLSLTDASKGYAENGGTHYSDSFRRQYLSAQRQRLNDLMAEAQTRLDSIQSGKGRFSDDEPFVVAGANQMRFYNRVFPQDLHLLAHTKGTYTLLHGDGTVTHEVVHSVRAPLQGEVKTTSLDAAMNTTVKGFLSACAIKVNPDFDITATGIEGVDWTSNINTPIGNASGITVPILMMGMTGSWEYLAAEMIYNACPSTDKSIAFVEGASHMFEPDKDAEKFQKKDYGDTVKVLFDYVDQWLSKKGRFM